MAGTNSQKSTIENWTCQLYCLVKMELKLTSNWCHAVSSKYCHQTATIWTWWALRIVNLYKNRLHTQYQKSLDGETIRRMRSSRHAVETKMRLHQHKKRSASRLTHCVRQCYCCHYACTGLPGVLLTTKILTGTPLTHGTCPTWPREHWICMVMENLQIRTTLCHHL